jgi:hypothetical protein
MSPREPNRVQNAGIERCRYGILLSVYIFLLYISAVEARGDHLCGLVVRVPGYRSRRPGSILGAARFSER